LLEKFRFFGGTFFSSLEILGSSKNSPSLPRWSAQEDWGMNL